MSFHERWNEEMCAAWLYRTVAASADTERERDLFAALEKTALGQAQILEEAMRKAGEPVPGSYRPTLRARVVAALTRLLGPRRMRGVLAAMKVRGLSIYNGPLPLADHPMPASVEEIGERHRVARGANSLRAAVFGVNDGLVSNASLILGVAGASQSHDVIVLTGTAGLLAGAFSMAAGEYVSVRSQRELYEHQIEQEREELEQYPEEEAEELALIYNARGISMERAREMARAIFRDPQQALRTLSIEELGVNPDELGSPWAAAASSFLAFAVGAAIPLMPYLLTAEATSPALVLAVSATALFLVGAAISLFSGRSALYGGLRMLAIGCAAGIATYVIGAALAAAPLG